MVALSPRGPNGANPHRRCFEALNLRHNPFEELEREELARIAVVDVPLPQDGEILQIIAPSGHGKTSHLLALASRMPGSHYACIEEGWRRYRGPAAGRILIDEAQRLSRRELKRLAASARSLVLGTHRDLGREIGRSVLTRHLRKLTAGRLASIVNRRIEAARRTAGPIPPVSDDTLNDMLRRHGSNVRTIIGELYGLFEEKRCPSAT